MASGSGTAGPRVNFSYYGNTGDERLQQIQNLNSSSGVISQFNYGYDADGDITSWQQANSALSGTNSFAVNYDAVNQLSWATLTAGTSSVTSYSYGYDSAGNRTQNQINSAAATSGYNHLNQLVSQSPGGLTEFRGSLSKWGTVTVAGNPATVTGTTGSYQFAGAASLLAGTNTVAIVATGTSGVSGTNSYQVVVSATGSAVTPSYDADGNMTSNGAGQSYQWDAANRLVKIWYGTAGNSASSTFSYDGLGHRVQIVETGSSGTITSTKNLIWDGMAIREERNASNALTKLYFSNGVQISGTNYYYTRDHLGSIREVTGTNGLVLARYDYDPYGVQTQVSGTMIVDFGYAGLYYHQPSGLLMPLNREYLPPLGRWTSRDPLRNAEMSQGPNLYEYVGNNPIGGVDPLGEWYVLNPVTWFNGSGYEGVSGGWDAYDAVTADAFQEGAYAALDGIDPFGTPFADNGFYNPCDEGAQISQGLGTFARNAALVAVIPNIAEWSQNTLLYEIGQTTVSPELYESVADMSAIERGQFLVDQAGGSYLRAMFGTAWGQVGNTIGTGLTPGGWLFLGGVAAWGDAEYKSH